LPKGRLHPGGKLRVWEWRGLVRGRSQFERLCDTSVAGCAFPEHFEGRVELYRMWRRGQI